MMSRAAGVEITLSARTSSLPIFLASRPASSHEPGQGRKPRFELVGYVSDALVPGSKLSNG